jgi:hypothetical protein
MDLSTGGKKAPVDGENEVYVSPIVAERHLLAAMRSWATKVTEEHA